MKKFLFLIGIFAIAMPQISAAQDELIDNIDYKTRFGIDFTDFEKILGYWQEQLEKFKESITNKVEEIELNIDDIINKTVQVIYKAAQEPLSNLQNLINFADNRQNNALECVDKYRPQLEKVLQDARDEIRVCVINALGEIYAIKDELKQYIDAIKEEIDSLQYILKKCIKPINPIYTIKCLFDHLSDAKESVTSIIKTAITALKESTLRLKEISEEAQACIRGVADDAEGKVRKLLQEFRNCLEQGLPTTPPPTPEPTEAEPESSAAPEPSTPESESSESSESPEEGEQWGSKRSV